MRSKVAIHPLFLAARKKGSTRELKTAMSRRHVNLLEPVQNSCTRKS
jgi:hypothetical protein